jgi:transaldolase
MTESKLDQLRQMTVVVADTGDIAAVRKFQPQDCTTNPSIVLKALQTDDFAEHFAQAVSARKGQSGAAELIAKDLTVAVGAELSALVPGRVSTEVDARLSFDRDASIAYAQDVIEAYAARGIDKSRVLIKLAATWEGISAAATLEKAGINCNLTLLFDMAQAKACADAGVFLISPFVGRITDWFGKASGETYTAETDPGVQSVRDIYNYYRNNGIDTVVMGASFRNLGQIEALAGCDRLTISPNLLGALDAEKGTLERKLTPPSSSVTQHLPKLSVQDFRWDMNESAMATEKLSDGIRSFHADTVKLMTIINSRLA